jgi:hypothetical protein
MLCAEFNSERNNSLATSRIALAARRVGNIKTVCIRQIWESRPRAWPTAAYTRAAPTRRSTRFSLKGI